MSGHSKWANIKNKKAKTDAVKGKIFTKLGRELAIAVKSGGPDPNTNGKLRDVIAKCKASNMPNDNIARTIKKYGAEGADDNYEDVVYEGYGPNGVAIIVECLTDNRNRTAPEMRHIFDKYGNGLGNSGCVSWMFDKKGVLVIERTSEMDEDELMMLALDSGAEDFSAEDDVFEVYTDPASFTEVREKLESEGLSFLSADISMIPQNSIDITDDELVMKINRIVDQLEDNDDVQYVWHNANLPEEEEED